MGAHSESVESEVDCVLVKEVLAVKEVGKKEVLAVKEVFLMKVVFLAENEVNGSADEVDWVGVHWENEVGKEEVHWEKAAYNLRDSQIERVFSQRHFYWAIASEILLAIYARNVFGGPFGSFFWAAKEPVLTFVSWTPP